MFCEALLLLYQLLKGVAAQYRIATTYCLQESQKTFLLRQHTLASLGGVIW